MGRNGISLKYSDEEDPTLLTWEEVDDIGMEQLEGGKVSVPPRSHAPALKKVTG